MEGEPMKPQRIQLSRKNGWKMPKDTVKVDRSTKWGNPFKVVKDAKFRALAIVDQFGTVRAYAASRTEASGKAVQMYRDWLTHNELGRVKAADAARQLRGKSLACWCKPGAACHASVLLELANAEVKP